jgi:hypothetical protein
VTLRFNDDRLRDLIQVIASGGVRRYEPEGCQGGRYLRAGKPPMFNPGELINVARALSTGEEWRDTMALGWSGDLVDVDMLARVHHLALVGPSHGGQASVGIVLNRSGSSRMPFRTEITSHDVGWSRMFPTSSEDADVRCSAFARCSRR